MSEVKILRKTIEKQRSGLGTNVRKHARGEIKQA